MIVLTCVSGIALESLINTHFLSASSIPQAMSIFNLGSLEKRTSTYIFAKNPIPIITNEVRLVPSEINTRDGKMANVIPFQKNHDFRGRSSRNKDNLLYSSLKNT